MMAEKKGINSGIEIYTDGGCDPNPGPGGWAAIILDGKEKTILKGYAGETTNNRMELTAALQALRALDGPKRVKFYTDSKYLQQGVEEWLPDWKARNWKRKGGQLANADLWREISEEITHHKITWQWVRGHAGNPLNEHADRIVNQVRLSKGK